MRLIDDKGESLLDTQSVAGDLRVIPAIAAGWQAIPFAVSGDRVELCGDRPLVSRTSILRLLGSDEGRKPRPQRQGHCTALATDRMRLHEPLRKTATPCCGKPQHLRCGKPQHLLEQVLRKTATWLSPPVLRKTATYLVYHSPALKKTSGSIWTFLPVCVGGCDAPLRTINPGTESGCLEECSRT